MRKCKNRKDWLLSLFKANTSEAALPSEGYRRTRLKECQSAALNGWQWMHLCKEKRLWEKMGGCVSGCWRGGTMEWKVREILGEFCETFRRRRQCDDGWGGKWWMRKRGKEEERGRTGESNCTVLDTSTENTLASCQSDRLAWLIFSSFQSAFHFAFFSFRMCPDATVMIFFFFTSVMLHVRVKWWVSHQSSWNSNR